jgi:CheY-like chemotaxis protein
MARRGVPQQKVINLNDLVSEYLKSPECKKLLEFHPSVYIKTDIDSPFSMIKGSSIHLFKVVMNLVSNASEAMPNGGTITISLRDTYIDLPSIKYDHVKEGEYVILSVADEGVGISEEDIKHIFEPFYSKKKMGRSGTGLGMAIVWGTVKDHSGFIDIQSIEGKGAIFSLYFPVTREGTKSSTTVLSIKDYMGNGQKILVVDDIKAQRELACMMLDKLGYNSMAVSSGEEAVAYLKNNSADLILLDMIMDPGMDGLLTYQKVLDFNPNQKAIIASGFSESEKIHEALRIGVGAYLKKPYSMEELGAAVKAEIS